MAELKINNNIIKTVIFDFDGTLARLNIDFDLMRKKVFKIILSYGVNNDNLHKSHILEMLHAAESVLANISPVKAENLKHEALSCIESLEIAAAKNGELFPRIKELLNVLKSHGISRGVVSRNCEKAIYTIFPDILSYCDAVVCRDFVKKVKPHPEHIHTALRLMKGEPGSALMIGDHPLDIQAGRLAGTFTAGVLSGHFEKHDFSNAGADLILDQATDLLGIIRW